MEFEGARGRYSLGAFDSVQLLLSMRMHEYFFVFQHTSIRKYLRMDANLYANTYAITLLRFANANTYIEIIDRYHCVAAI